jgi:hypothetical protein
MQTLVRPSEIDRFRQTYVSLHALAKEHGRHHLSMKQMLEEIGIEPAFDHTKVGARFYRRSDLPKNKPAQRLNS